MYRYQHGGNAVFEPNAGEILDLSANINPLGCPEAVETAIIEQLPFITRYPDSLCRELRRAIAEREQAAPEHIFCGNGASDIIFRLPVCIHPDTALLPAPTFSDYERALAAVGARVIRHTLTERQGFRLDGGFVDAVTDIRPDIVFLCNPNNPTGVLTERPLMEALLSACERVGTLAVVDECFMDFVEDADGYTVKPLLERFNNLVILKAFTKTFALPGIRLGYALCANADMVGRLHESGPDWAVSNLAQAAGTAALRHMPEEYLRETVAYVSRERAYIKAGLDKPGFTAFDSRANYVFFKSTAGGALPALLGGQGIRIRDCGNYAGLTGDYFRVAVSSAENNQKFIRTVKELWT